MERKEIVLSLLLVSSVGGFSQQIWSTQNSSNGCDKYHLIKNKIVKNGNVDYLTPIPTSFTPNGDGLNDIFSLPKEINACANSFEIYNRWGQLVYQSNEFLYWDGVTFSENNAPAGIYFYTFKLNDQPYKGTLVLFR